MHILADCNIPYAAEAFAAFGDVIALPPAQIDAAAAAEADLLLVRSVTKVDASLLTGSRVRFVATATIGTDHVDVAWLRENDIAFASAPGCNANSVSEWVTAALLHLTEVGESGRRGIGESGSRGVEASGDRCSAELSLQASPVLGIVGVGNVGRRVAMKAQALGLRVLLNDPPRARAESGAGFVTLDELLAEADIVTTHVPLEKGGEDPTFELANADFFARMKPGAWFLNASRGGVVDEMALRAALESGHLGGAILDVFRGEPNVSRETLARAELVTPHVAGYSTDGKINGTTMIYQAACRAYGFDPVWTPPQPEPIRTTIATAGLTDSDIIRRAVASAYDIIEDSERTRTALASGDVGPAFTRLRQEYPLRYEFHHHTLRLDPPRPEAQAALEALGFEGR